MKKLFSAVLFLLCAIWGVVANAATINFTQDTFVLGNHWSSVPPFKEYKKGDEGTFSLTTRDHNDREYESKEKEHHFDFDRDDRWFNHTEICDKPSLVPIPGSALLFLSGLVGLIKFKRKS